MWRFPIDLAEGYNRRARGRGSIVASCALLIPLVANCTVGGDDSYDSSKPPLVPFPNRVAEGVYILGGLEPSSAYAIETPDGLVLVDSGLESDASVLKG